MTTRKCVSGVVSATLATIVLTGASWAEDVRPPAVGTAPAKSPSSLALPHHVTGQVVSVNKPAKTVYAQNHGWRHDTPHR